MVRTTTSSQLWLQMLRKIEFFNWKSFKASALHIDQLTILIGTNASGKSNALDALEFLSRVASSTDISVALGGDANTEAIRGDSEWASYLRGSSFSLRVTLGTDDPKTDFEYHISVTTHSGHAELEGESLTRIRYQGNNARRLRLFWTDTPDSDFPGIIARLYNTKAGTKRPLRRNLSILSQLEVDPNIRSEIYKGVETVSRDLRGIFLLDPNPSAMRNFSRLSESLNKDGSNVAGVLMALPDAEREEIQKTLTNLAAKLPEKDIKRVWAEYVGRHQSDAMLYCVEEWQEGHEFDVDARGMSDGTLRFIAVIGALLLRPEGSTVVVEEIDNGLHPSRALLLLRAISAIAERRNVDLLITTHNVALLDSIPPSLIRSVSVATRDESDGSSKIISLDDVPLLSRVLAEGEVGALSRRGVLESTLKDYIE